MIASLSVSLLLSLLISSIWVYTTVRNSMLVAIFAVINIMIHFTMYLSLAIVVVVIAINGIKVGFFTAVIAIINITIKTIIDTSIISSDIDDNTINIIFYYIDIATFDISIFLISMNPYRYNKKLKTCTKPHSSYPSYVKKGVRPSEPTLFNYFHDF